MADGRIDRLREAEAPLLPLPSRRRKKLNRLTSKAYSESVNIALICTAVVALGPIQYGFCNGYTSPVQDSMMEDLNLTVSEFSWFGSMSNIGGMVGALASGPISDLLGRKGALLAAAVPNICGWVAIALSEGVYTLYIGRLLVGFGVGMISFVVPIYIAEIAPMRLRGTLGTANQFSVTFGILLSYLIGMAADWRPLAIIGAVPCTLLILGLPAIPESPRWLAKVEHEEFKSALQVLRGKNTNISAEAHLIQEAVAIDNQESSVSIFDLFRKPYLRPLIISVGLLSFQQLGGINALVFYSSTIFQSAGFPSTDIASLAVAVLMVAMTLVSGALIDKAGRRILLLVSASGTTLTCFLVGLAYFLRVVWFSALPAATFFTLVYRFCPEMLPVELPATSNFTTALIREQSSSTDVQSFTGYLSLTSLLVYVAAFSIGLGAVPWIVMSEVFPSRIKGRAGSLATVLNWFWSWLVTLSFNILLSWNAPGTFGIYTGISFLTVVFVALLVPETKGKDLEEIQLLFR